MNTISLPSPWRVSLHGGHSGQFCDHARGTLREVVEAAHAAGYAAFGLSEHAPRTEARFLYPDEVAMGWDVPRLASMFDAYVVEARALQDEFADRIELLVGFEAEVVPAAAYVSQMRALRARHALDFMVGSVHHVDELLIDGPLPFFEQALARRGSIEALAVAYYEQVAEMVGALNPDVVGHLDLIRKNGIRYGYVDTPAIERAACAALDVIAARGAILDLNTAGWRKGLGGPYPSPWLVAAATERGIAFCIGDDSHGPHDVGSGLDAARAYLLEQGVRSVTTLRRRAGATVRQVASLDQPA